MENITKPWAPTITGGAPVSLREAMGQAVGTASMSWEHVDRAGAFDEGNAKWVLEGMLTWLNDWAATIKETSNGGEPTR